MIPQKKICLHNHLFIILKKKYFHNHLLMKNEKI